MTARQRYRQLMLTAPVFSSWAHYRPDWKPATVRPQRQEWPQYDFFIRW